MADSLIFLPLAGAFVGLVVGLTGVGGGALMAPILLFGFDYDFMTVVATDLLFATMTKLVATGIHSRSGFVDWYAAKRLWHGSIPATLCVLVFVYLGLVSAAAWVQYVLGVLIIVSGVTLILGSKVHGIQRSRRVAAPKHFKHMQYPATVISGIFLGAAVTLTSIGAGALGAVLLRALYPLRMVPKTLVATDTIHAVPISLLGGVGYLMLGEVDLILLLMLLLGSLPAVLLGCRMLHWIRSDIIKFVLAVVLILSGGKILFS